MAKFAEFLLALFQGIAVLFRLLVKKVERPGNAVHRQMRFQVKIRKGVQHIRGLVRIACAVGHADQVRQLDRLDL